MTDRFVKLSASNDAGDGLTEAGYLAGRAGMLSAWNKSEPGDNILLLQPDNGGEIYAPYSLKLTGKSGSSGNPITIKPAPGHTIVISGDRRWPVKTNYSTKIYTELWWLEGNYITVEDISFVKCMAFGFRVNPDGRKVGFSSNITLRRCKFTHNHHGGLVWKYVYNMNVEECLVAYNECTSNKNSDWDYNDHGYGVGGECARGLIFRYNTVHDNAGEGVLIDGTAWVDGDYSTDVQIYGNVICNNPEVNLYIHALGGSDNKLIYGNLIYNTPDSYFSKANNPSWSLPNYDNIINIWLATIEIWTFKHDYDCRSNKIYNNIIGAGHGVIYNRAGESNGVHQYNDLYNNLFLRCSSALSSWKSLSSPTGNNIRNNVFVVGDGGRVTSGSLVGSEFSTISNNCFYIESGGTGPPSWMRGAGDIVANPRLVNINASLAKRLSLNPANYAPDTSYPSPLIDAGATVPFASTDYYGNSRSGAYDIGPIESGSGGTPPTIPKSLNAAWTNQDESSGVVVLNEGDSTTFIDATIAQGGATVESRSWSFTGGSPSSDTASSVNVTYDIAGIYPVSLTVQDVTNGITDTETRTQYVYVAEAPPQSTDVLYKIIQFNVGDASIPVPFTPKAMLFVVGNCVSAETITDGMSLSIGKRDLSGANVQSNTLQKNGVSSEGGYRRSISNGIAQIHTAENTSKFSGSVSSVTSSAINLSWTGDTSDAEIGYVIIAGGDAVVSAVATRLDNLNSVGDTQTVNGTYNVAIALSTLAIGSWSPCFSYGFSVKGGSSVCSAIYGTGWGTPGLASSQIRNDSIASIAASTARVETTFNASSVEFALAGAALNNNAANDGVHVILLNTGLLKATCGVIDLPVTTTEMSVPLTFDPGLILIGATNLAAAKSVNTEYDSGSDVAGLLLHGATVNESFSYGIGIEYDAAAVTENAFTYTSAEFVQYAPDRTIVSDVTGAATGVNPGDMEFTISLDPAGGGKAVYLAIEGAQAYTPPAGEQEDNISRVGVVAGLRPGAI